MTESDIYIRIKERRQKIADKTNRKTTITYFDIGDKVLSRTNPISDAMNHVVAKFCDLYEGPFLIKEKIGKATYKLARINGKEKERGIFNIRQLKRYNV